MSEMKDNNLGILECAKISLHKGVNDNGYAIEPPSLPELAIEAQYIMSYINHNPSLTWDISGAIDFGTDQLIVTVKSEYRIERRVNRKRIDTRTMTGIEAESVEDLE